MRECVRENERESERECVCEWKEESGVWQLRNNLTPGACSPHTPRRSGCGLRENVLVPTSTPPVEAGGNGAPQNVEDFSTSGRWRTFLDSQNMLKLNYTPNWPLFTQILKDFARSARENFITHQNNTLSHI